MDANYPDERLSLAAQFRLAVAFLTRLPVQQDALDEGSDDRDDEPDPVPLDPARDPAQLAAAMWLFPLVGFGIGGTGAIVLALLSWAGVPGLAASAIAVGAIIWLTGALHEDGLSDVADGFGGGRDTATKMAIMRDSRLGAYGAVALGITLIAKIAALGALAELNPGAAAGALIAAATWSRAMFAPTMRWLEPARTDGVGAGAGTPREGTSWTGLLLGAALALLVLMTPAGAGVFVVLIAGGLGAFAVGWIALRQIGGYTGDVLGAGQQIAETAALVAACAVIPHVTLLEHTV